MDGMKVFSFANIILHCIPYRMSDFSKNIYQFRHIGNIYKFLIIMKVIRKEGHTMKKATITSFNAGSIPCWACTICGACPVPTIGTALTGVSIL